MLILWSQSKAVIVILRAEALATSMLRNHLLAGTGAGLQQQAEQMSMLGRLTQWLCATHKAAAMLITWIQHMETGSTRAAALAAQVGQGRLTETATAHVSALHRAKSLRTQANWATVDKRMVQVVPVSIERNILITIRVSAKPPVMLRMHASTTSGIAATIFANSGEFECMVERH